MKVCFLSSMHTPRDKRVFEKEAVSLAQHGYQVTHLAPGKEPSGRWNGVWLEIYPPMHGLKGRLLGMIRLYRRAARLDADIYHCNEIDSWLIGIFLKLRRNKKVIFDAHETYPEDFGYEHLPPSLRPLGAFLLRLLFQMLAPFTDHFIFAKRSVAGDYPGTESRSRLVMNYSRASLYGGDAAAAVPADVRALFHGKFTAIHVGLFNRQRGWPQMLEAMRMIKIPNFQFLSIGEITDGSEEALRQKAKEYGLEDRVIVQPWVEYNVLIGYLRCSQVGLVLFQPGVPGHTNALPHKMYDYMNAGMPVIIPDFAVEIASDVTGADCGILVNTADPSQIASALEKLHGDEGLRQRMGQNGRNAVVTRFNWEAEECKLLAAYEELKKRA